MNIIVCIKQVPSTNKVEVDSKTGVLKRDNISCKLNTYDLYALETAFRIKEQCGANITALTMGPSQAALILKEAIYMGADSGVLLTDRRFGGADVFATSYALSQCIKKLGGADIIICGKQTTDGDTGQVGAEIAEISGFNYISNVTSIEEISQNSITIISDIQYAEYKVKASYPCLISVEKDIYTPRLPSLKRKFSIENIEEKIKTVDLDSLYDTDQNKYGLKGSPTQVEKIYAPEVKKERAILQGSADLLSQKLYDVLKVAIYNQR